MEYFIIGALCFALGFYVCIRLTLMVVKKGKLPAYLKNAGLRLPEEKK